MMVNSRKLAVTACAVVFFGIVLSFFSCAFAQETAAAAMNPETAKMAFLSAAIVMGLSIIGAGVAVAYVGSAAVGAISEKPELIGSTIAFVALAEGLAILGFTVAFMILNKVG
jgi:V/A-type H+-transporting ATPase subunit K